MLNYALLLRHDGLRLLLPGLITLTKKLLQKCRSSVQKIHFTYLCCSIFFTKFALGCAPTNLSTTSPFLINKMAGMEVMP
jgi:hypothetical protein